MISSLFAHSNRESMTRFTAVACVINTRLLPINPEFICPQCEPAQKKLRPHRFVMVQALLDCQKTRNLSAQKTNPKQTVSLHFPTKTTPNVEIRIHLALSRRPPTVILWKRLKKAPGEFPGDAIEAY